MSLNFPDSGSNSSIERVASSEAVLRMNNTVPKKASADNKAGLPLSIKNMSDLKKAELRGEYYTISDEQLIKAIEKSIQAMQGKTTTLEFTVHDKTKIISVKVKDANTGEVIREIPPEKTLDFVAKLWQMAGMLIDEKR
ncbi:MAG: flagellar protein FlaG protein [Cohnella sp.]|nr:flagellar protein FlaG protein [Cohnella sp.]